MLFNEWTNVVSSIRNELVFEGRNQEYGAYQIRRSYNRSVSIALLITFSALVLAIVVPKIIELINNTLDTTKEVVVDLTDPIDMVPPPLDETEPPPPPPPPPPVAATVKFIPPVIEDDAPEDEEPPPIIEEAPKNISTVTNEGDGSNEVLIPDEGKGVVAVEEEIFRIVEEMPTFPGGDVEMLRFLKKNIQYPPMEQEAGISGTVYLGFLVDKEGNIADVQIVRGIASGPNLAKEALRVVKMMPGWKAGKQNGRPVKVQFTLPVKFSLK